MAKWIEGNDSSGQGYGLEEGIFPDGENGIVLNWKRTAQGEA